MEGFKRAQIDAERDLNVTQHHFNRSSRTDGWKSQIPVHATRHSCRISYGTLRGRPGLQRHAVGIGLDSNEYNRPPSLFEELYLRA